MATAIGLPSVADQRAAARGGGGLAGRQGDPGPRHGRHAEVLRAEPWEKSSMTREGPRVI